MQVGTEILLARMKEHPDEFFHGNYGNRWMSIIDDSKKYLPREDVEALDEGYRQMQIDRFNERVLARLAGEGKQELEETLTYKTSERYTTGWVDPRATIGPTQQEYEQAVKQKQHELDMQQRAMMRGAQNSLLAGANGNSIADWLTGGNK